MRAIPVPPATCRLASAIVAAFLASSCSDSRSGPMGVVRGEPAYSYQGLQVTGSARDSVFAFDSTGAPLLLDSGQWTFSYTMDSGTATRGFVPALPPNNLSEQGLRDTLPFYRPSAAHMVASEGAVLLIGGAQTKSSVFYDSAGIARRMELSSEQVTPRPLPCLPEGCPMSTIRVFGAAVGGRLEHESRLYWNVTANGYQLQRYEITFFDSLGQPTVKVTAPVSNSSFASLTVPSNSSRPMRAFGSVLFAGAQFAKRGVDALAPKSLYAGEVPCQKEAWVAAAVTAAAIQAIAVARQAKWLDPGKDLAVVVTVIASMAANSSLAECMSKNGMA